MTSLIADLRQAVRTLARRPGFAVLVVTTIALAIGANTAVFSVVHGIVLRPMPYPEADRLVMVFEGLPRSDLPRMMVSAADFTDFREQQRTFVDLAAFANHEFEFATADGPPERVTGARVSASLFPLLGIRPLLGRAFAEAENDPGASRVAVLSYAFWQRRFGGDPAVRGRTVVLDREIYTVVGVLPRGRTFPHRVPEWEHRPADVFVPIAFTPGELAVRGGGYNKSVIGRLRPDVSLDQARADVLGIARRIHDDAFPASLRTSPSFELTATVEPYHDVVVGPVRPALLVLLGAVALVLLVACADVAGLMFVRAVGRRREVAIRTALGANRGRVVRVFVAEGLVLAAAGGVAGLLLSVTGAGTLLTLAPATLPRAGEVGLTGAVLGLGLFLTLGAAALFGLAPLLLVSPTSLGGALRAREAAAAFPGGRGGPWAQRILVISTVALAVVLLTGAGLLVRSLAHVLATDPGFQPDRVLSVRLPLALQEYDRAAEIRAFYREVLARARVLPGVTAVGASNDLPLFGQEQRAFWPEEDDAVASGTLPAASHSWVMGDYFAAQRIPLRRGRYFGPEDGPGAPLAMIVSEGLAARVWPGQDAVGKRLKLGTAETRAPWFTVVGVVANVSDGAPEAEPRPHTYMPYAQAADFWLTLPAFPQLRSLFLVIRTVGDPTALTAPVRDAVADLDPRLALADVRTMAQQVGDSLAPRRFLLFLVAVFAGAALLLAALGLYGVLSYSVTQRTRELGLRSALGARPGDVSRLVVRQGMMLTAAGLAVGVAAALAGGRVLASQLVGVTPRDPVTLATVVLLSAGVAALASYLPARRATRVDPMVALRSE